MSDLGSLFPTEHLMARRKESEATVSGKGAGYGRSLLPLGAEQVPGAGAGADLLSVVESGQQIKNVSLGTLTITEGHQRLPLIDLRGCWLLPATEMTRSALKASLRRTGTSDRNP